MKCHSFCMQAKSTVNERIRWSMHEGRALVLINNLKNSQARVRAECSKQLFEASKKKKKKRKKKKKGRSKQNKQTEKPSKELLKDCLLRFTDCT